VRTVPSLFDLLELVGVAECNLNPVLEWPSSIPTQHTASSFEQMIIHL